MIFTVAMVGFVIAGVCAGARLLIGPTLADRVVAMDVALVTLMGAVAAWSAETGQETYLSFLVVISIVGFTATVAASKFVEAEASGVTEAEASGVDGTADTGGPLR
jgi:multicomponent Na+:H+ antiporter subunit F